MKNEKLFTLSEIITLHNQYDEYCDKIPRQNTDVFLGKSKKPDFLTFDKWLKNKYSSILSKDDQVVKEDLSIKTLVYTKFENPFKVGDKLKLKEAYKNSLNWGDLYWSKTLTVKTIPNETNIIFKEWSAQYPISLFKKI